MPVAQITIRLSPAVKAEFEVYAAELGLDSSELAKLLIVRERSLKRLFNLKRTNSAPAQLRRRSGSGTRLPTITAHLSRREHVEEFDTYARSCGLNRNSAGAWLLERELEEKWLKRAIWIH